MSRTLMKRGAIAALSASLIAAGFLAWELPLIPRSQTMLVVKIPRDLKTTRDIADELFRTGALRHPRLFVFLSRLFQWDRKFKRGTYLFRKGEAWPILTMKLLRRDTFSIKVTIPEGWTARQIAERLEAHGISKAADFLGVSRRRALEGYLYPTTYFLEPDLTGEEAADAMRTQFESVWRERFAATPMPPKFDQHKVVTLASIIERETTLVQEKPLIAGVYLNRLRQGWKLEADPTVQYALGTWKKRLAYKDLKIDSPYNTYQRFGLPPGPIANPGADCIAAALAPQATRFMYFVARGDGSHMFFETLKEHNRYRRLLKAQRSAGKK